MKVDEYIKKYNIKDFDKSGVGVILYAYPDEAEKMFDIIQGRNVDFVYGDGYDNIEKILVEIDGVWVDYEELKK